MRDRLIELIAESAIKGDYTYIPDVADYLLANGVIVPFAACGTDIYGVFEWHTESVLVGTLVSYSIHNDGLWFYCTYANGLTMWHKGEDYGKTVLLTREEAEAALAEREGNE